MTYLQFHFAFTFPLLLLIVGLTWRDLRLGHSLAGELGQTSRFALVALLVHVIIAVVYTSPWDNFLVYKGVWGYPEGRVLLSIGYVPIEEYLFFVVQTILTGLFLMALGRHLRPLEQPVSISPGLIRLLGAAFFLLLFLIGALALRFDKGTYLGLILVWSAPILVLQWGFGGDYLLQRRRVLLLAISIPTVYLWFADALAIRFGIWWIDPEQTTGIQLFGLPLEEALFFLATNILISFGMLLALHPSSFPRMLYLVAKIRPWSRTLLILWAVSMIPTPLVPGQFTILVQFSTILLALGVLAYTVETYGRKAYLLFAVSLVFGFGVEWLGSTTGVPFGAYQYNAAAPSLIGVPLLVPLGWWAFTVVAIAAAPRRGRVLLAPLVLVAWDLGLDPLMVHMGFWTFERPGVYGQVPFTNFAGWYVAGAFLTLILLRLEPRLGQETRTALRTVFGIQAGLMVFGLLFFGLFVPGVVTALGMGTFMLFWKSFPASESS